MTPADQLAHFSGGTDDLAMSGLWYSHKRVTELVQAAKAEALRDAADVFEWAGDDEDYAALRQWLRDRAAFEEGR